VEKVDEGGNFYDRWSGWENFTNLGKHLGITYTCREILSPVMNLLV
jgi:hypothetical protein